MFTNFSLFLFISRSFVQLCKIFPQIFWSLLTNILTVSDNQKENRLAAVFLMTYVRYAFFLREPFFMPMKVRTAIIAMTARGSTMTMFWTKPAIRWNTKDTPATVSA